MKEELFLFFDEEETRILLSMLNFLKEINILPEESAKLDGIIKKISDSLFSLDDEDLVDIPKKFKENYLEQSYSELISSFEIAEEGITISVDENIRYANPAFIKLLGYDSLDTVLRLGFSNFISRQYYQKIKNYYENRLKGEIVPNIYDIELIRADGAKILIDCVNYCMPFQKSHLLITFYISLKNLKNLEIKLRKSEEVSRNILDNSSFMIYQFNLKTKLFDYISPSSIEMFGYSPEEMKSLEFKELIDLMHPEDKERFQKHFDTSIKQDTEKELNLSIEYRFKHKKLGYRWFDSHHSVIFVNMHNPISIVGNVRDITKCKSREEELSLINKELAEYLAEKSIELQETIQNYKNLIDITNTGYLVIDEKGLVLYANLEYIHMSGHRLLKEILGRSIIEWTADHQKDKITQKLMKCATQGSLGTLNVDYKDKDGKITMIEINTDIYKTEEGYRIIGICHDVTGYKKLVQKLKKSQQRLQKFMDSATEGFIILDSKLNFISVNKVALQIVGMSKEEIIGKNILEIVPNLRETGRYDKYLDVIKTGKPSNFNEVFFNRQDINVSYSLSIKAFKMGADLGIIFIDITEYQKTEIRLKESEKQLRKLNKELEEKVQARTEELKESEENYKTILDGIVTGVWVTDKDDIIYYTNRGMEEIAGIPSEQIISANVLIDFVESTLKFFRPYFVKAKNSLKPVFYESVLVETPAGRQSFQSGWLIPLEKKGIYDGMICTVEDVTERKKAEDTLRLHSEIMTNMAEGVYLNRTYDGIITYTNPKFEKMFGYNQGEIIGKHVSIVNAPTDSSPQETAMKIMETLKNKGAWHGEVKNIKKDGTLFWCNANVSTFDHPEHGRVWVSVHTDITEHKKAEQKLKESEKILAKFNIELEQKIKERTKELINSEQKLRGFMDSATEGFVILDSNLNYINVNRVALRILRMDNGELIGKNCLDIVPNLRETGRYDKYLEVIKTGKPFSTEDVIFNKEDGSLSLYLSVRAFKVGDNLGIIFTDITDRRKNEKIINELAKFPSENPNPVLRVTNVRVLYANDEAKFLFNVKEGSYVPVMLRAQLKESLSNNTRQLINLKIKDNIYSFSINPIERMGYANLYGRDVTKQTESENKLKKSENNLKERVKELICLYSLSKLIKEPNISLNILFQNTLDIIRVAYQFPKSIHVKIEYDKDVYITNNFKETEWKLSTNVNLNDHSMKINVYYNENIAFLEEEVFLLNEIGSRLKDILEGKEARDKLIEAQEQLIRHEKLAVIGKLAGSIGHELRNPLGVINNSIYYLNLKLKDIDVDDKVKKHLKIMQEEVRTSNSIISNILDFSKIRNLLFEEVEVNAILEEIVDSISFPENIILEKQFSAEIPRLLLDPFQIKLAFRNIVLNAVQAMSDGGKLKIKSKTSGKMVKIIFEDTGKGITKENLPKIFGPLFSTKVKGIGLGLSMAKDVIEKHDGFVKVDSEVDVGTTFTIVLPLIRKELK